MRGTLEVILVAVMAAALARLLGAHGWGAIVLVGATVGVLSAVLAKAGGASSSSPEASSHE